MAGPAHQPDTTSSLRPGDESTLSPPQERLVREGDYALPEVTVVVPPEPPVLTPLAAEALLRLLHAVHRRRARTEDADGTGEADHDRHPGDEKRRAA